MGKSETMSSTKVLTPEFRVSFPNVFKARADFDGQEAKFSIVMLFPKTTDLSSLKKLCQAVVIEKWGADKTKWPKNLRTPFRDGDAEKPDMDGYAGHIFIGARSKTRPGVVDGQRLPILVQEEFYAGCYARATINAFAYDKAGNTGVSFGLQNIQKLRDGEPFSGRTKAEDDFDAVTDTTTTDTVAPQKATGGMFD